jgi:hypothetical protein
MAEFYSLARGNGKSFLANLARPKAISAGRMPLID